MSISAVHIVSRITDEASGPTYSVVELCKALREDKVDTTLAVLDANQTGSFPGFVKSFPLTGLPVRLGRSSSMRDWLREAVTSNSVDIVHNHGLWMMPNIYAGQATLGTNIPLIVSPRGTLSSWALNRSKWVKRVFWLTGQSKAIKHAACFHATAEHEFRDIRRAGFKQPVCIIPNGVDIPGLSSVPVANDGRRRLLFLGRIHPVKGIDILLRAWAVISVRFTDWELEIVGPDSDGYLAELKELACSLKLERVTFNGPCYGQDKIRRFQKAEIYVLPSHSENFGMTVAESLAAGTPAIVSHGAPWSGLEPHGAGWWIEIGVDPLVACLEAALGRSPEQLVAMGDQGREWMKQDFSWCEIAHKMKTTYQWLLRGGGRPAWVKCN